jgi:cytochrome c-type biogenesis protein CcmE
MAGGIVGVATLGRSADMEKCNVDANDARRTVLVVFNGHGPP